jgi:hypothetical protein
MKKLLLCILAASVGCSLFSLSYTNNTYQRLADEYTKKAASAFNAGMYDQAVEYSKKAEENAALSQGYIDMMMARSNADQQLKIARDKMDWAKKIRADKNFPMAYSAGETALNSAQTSYASEDYKSAAEYAGQVVAALDGVYEITPLPQFYIVRPWADTKDCYWNISGRPYIYNNPLLWENLYQKNKKAMPKAEDPNLILPGMKMEIPSLSGEYREGTYDPSKKYNAYDVNR